MLCGATGSSADGGFGFEVFGAKAQCIMISGGSSRDTKGTKDLEGQAEALHLHELNTDLFGVKLLMA